MVCTEVSVEPRIGDSVPVISAALLPCAVVRRPVSRTVLLEGSALLDLTLIAALLRLIPNLLRLLVRTRRLALWCSSMLLRRGLRRPFLTLSALLW